MDIKFSLDWGAYAPEKAHEDDAGYDLRLPGAYSTKTITDECLQMCVIDTGVHVSIPKGYVGLIKGRSGLNFNRDVFCPDGVVDSGFTGSLKIKLYGAGRWLKEPLQPGDKVAQLLIMPIADCNLVQVDRLEETERGNSGFGSTGR